MKEIKKIPILKLYDQVIIDGKRYGVMFIHENKIGFFIQDGIPLLYLPAKDGVLTHHTIIEYPDIPTESKLCCGYYIACPKCCSELEVCETHHRLTNHCKSPKVESVSFSYKLANDHVYISSGPLKMSPTPPIKARGIDKFKIGMKIRVYGIVYADYRDQKIFYSTDCNGELGIIRYIGAIGDIEVLIKGRPLFTYTAHYKQCRIIKEKK